MQAQGQGQGQGHGQGQGRELGPRAAHHPQGHLQVLLVVWEPG